MGTWEEARFVKRIYPMNSKISLKPQHCTKAQLRMESFPIVFCFWGTEILDAC